MEKEESVAITLTKSEFNHLQNDLIKTIWDLEERGLDKDDTYGYLSRTNLLNKLKYLEQAYFVEGETE